VQVRRSVKPCLFQENKELPGEQDAMGGTMKLRNVLIVVRDIERSRKYYHDLFGLETVLDNDGNMILTEGLVLQDAKIWENFLGKDIILRNNASELYFEERDIEGFIQKLEELYPDTVYVNRLMTHSWGQRVVRFYDPDGNLIEVGTPME
jgi:catechol 2,3-dioxygenase-like lactoylglutathione lyase family enzyme